MARGKASAFMRWALDDSPFQFVTDSDPDEVETLDTANPEGGYDPSALPAGILSLAVISSEGGFHAAGFEWPGMSQTAVFETSLSAKGGRGKSTDGTDSTGGGNGGGKGNSGKNDAGGTVLTEYTSGGEASTSYNIDVVFEGEWSAALQQAVIAAADFISSIILSDIPDVVVSDGSAVDDLRITASLENIDGTGGVLGQAGPSWIRFEYFLLPADGSMTFDSSDADAKLAAGTWENIVLHEMLHVLGFGSIWDALGLTSGSIAGGDLRFTGDNAIVAYNSEFADIALGDPDSLLGVPIETDGGLGTAGGHWDEFLFDNELMTGFIDDSNYLSDMSVAALEDMGYDTVFDGALLA